MVGWNYPDNWMVGLLTCNATLLFTFFVRVKVAQIIGDQSYSPFVDLTCN